MTAAASSANAAQAEFWNSQAARGWADQHERMDRVLVPLLEALMTAAALLLYAVAVVLMNRGTGIRE